MWEDYRGWRNYRRRDSRGLLVGYIFFVIFGAMFWLAYKVGSSISKQTGIPAAGLAGGIAFFVFLYWLMSRGHHA